MTIRQSTVSTRTVATCYAVFDGFFPNFGAFDLTDGIYAGPDTSYEQAQCNQINYLLDEVRCTRGTRVLDVGCGYGTLVREARRRWATATGITIAPEQVARCRRQGLDVQLVNYKDLGDAWNHRFDAIIANGSIEHFVMPSDVAAGKSDAVYTQMFHTFHRLIDPQSPIRRVCTTVIHCVRCPKPEDWGTSPFHFPYGSDSFHYSLLAHGFGGSYPQLGQLERCAEGCFKLVHSVDGTADYYRTSEDWLKRWKAVLRTPQLLRVIWELLPMLVGHPQQFSTLVMAAWIAKSWHWQFRPPNPPTRLLRQTWEYD